MGIGECPERTSPHRPINPLTSLSPQDALEAKFYVSETRVSIAVEMLQGSFMTVNTATVLSILFLFLVYREIEHEEQEQEAVARNAVPVALDAVDPDAVPAISLHRQYRRVAHRRARPPAVGDSRADAYR